MAEVFGIVTGVLGLLPLCRGMLISCLTASGRNGWLTIADGIGMIKDVFDATRTLDLAVGRLELQRDVRS